MKWECFENAIAHLKLILSDSETHKFFDSHWLKLMIFIRINKFSKFEETNHKGWEITQEFEENRLTFWHLLVIRDNLVLPELAWVLTVYYLKLIFIKKFYFFLISKKHFFFSVWLNSDENIILKLKNNRLFYECQKNSLFSNFIRIIQKNIKITN
jgi:hypothetical protein